VCILINPLCTCYAAGKKGSANAQVLTGLIYTTEHGTKPFYTGGTLEGGSANGWYWMSLNNTLIRLKDTDFVNWLDGHPQQHEHTPMRESCMHMEGNNKFQWVSSHCHISKTFICHFSAVPQRLRNRQGRKGKGRRRHRHDNRRENG
jgi:hypothetical protein